MSIVPTASGRASLRRSVRLFRLFLAEQSDPNAFYSALAADSVAQLGAFTPLPGASVLDVGGGPGYFGRAFKQAGARYIGVELDAPAVKAARRNAARRQRSNGEFLLGRVEDWLPGLLARFSAEKTAILFDPPRTGCPADSLASVRQARPAQVLYVSCHPATLARDLNILCAGDVFKLKSVVPLDMFPQSQHVECVADLRQRVEE